MAIHDAAPLTDEEREELEALREEKARREAEEAAERARRDRAELERLRAEQREVDEEILAERAAEQASGPRAGRAAASSAEQASGSRAGRPAAFHAAEGHSAAPAPAHARHAEGRPASRPAHAQAPARDRGDLTFGQKMVMTPEAESPDDIPGMAPAQKIIIALAIVAVIAGAIYIGLTNAGLAG